jgi:hypothetical protein
MAVAWPFALVGAIVAAFLAAASSHSDRWSVAVIGIEDPLAVVILGGLQQLYPALHDPTLHAGVTALQRRRQI